MCFSGGQAGVAQQRYPNAEAAWQAAWKEGRRLVQVYQAELKQGTWDAGRLAAEAHATTEAGTSAAAQAEKLEPQLASSGLPNTFIHVMPFKHPFSSRGVLLSSIPLG